MEGTELDRTDERKIIASAAHTDRKSSIENAWQEAIERISLAAWWALDRPFISTVPGTFVDELLAKNHVKKPDGFSVHIGFVESIHPLYYVACGIMVNDKAHPYAVLGGGCSKDATLAADKALYESIQSWTATEWIDSNCDVSQKVYWDIGELEKRISGLFEVTADVPKKIVPTTGNSYVDGLSARVSLREGIYVTEIVEPRQISHTTRELAKLAMRENERISVFTPHNV